MLLMGLAVVLATRERSVLSLVVALGGFALYSNSQVSAVTDRIYSKNMKGLIEVNALIDTFNTMRGDVQKALLFNDDGAELAQSLQDGGDRADFGQHQVFGDLHRQQLGCQAALLQCGAQRIGQRGVP